MSRAVSVAIAAELHGAFLHPWPKLLMEHCPSVNSADSWHHFRRQALWCTAVCPTTVTAAMRAHHRCAVPDRRQKGLLHPGSRSPEALLVRELVAAVQGNPAAAAACLKLQGASQGGHWNKLPHVCSCVCVEYVCVSPRLPLQPQCCTQTLVAHVWLIDSFTHSWHVPVCACAVALLLPTRCGSPWLL